MNNSLNILSRFTSIAVLTVYLMFGVASSLHHHHIDITTNSKLISNSGKQIANLEHCFPLHTKTINECSVVHFQFFAENSFHIVGFVVPNQPFVYNFKLQSFLQRGPPVIV